MNGFTSLETKGLYGAEVIKDALRFWFRTSRILILVDGGIKVLPDPAPEIAHEFVISSAFGISNVIALLKNFSSGFSSFAVTVATRNGDGSPVPGHDLTGFRFNDAELEKYDQVWMFGINPGNILPDSTNPADDAEIEDSSANPLSDSELAALAKWMDAGGGVFATGDHHFLGASMCHRVPRVSTMRRWTISDGVPTMNLTTRYDTNRPATSSQVAGASVIPNSVERDAVPQRIEWVAYASVRQSAFAYRRRPHPLLCHPTLGPIDILPDHPHEGLCYDFSDSTWQSQKRDLTFSFAGYSNDHYPTRDGLRPLPQVVAWGTTLADPPLQFQKGDQAARRFPQIAAYDGQAIGIGRVVVDSTWHHWFDMNLMGLEQRARDTGDRTDIDRILRYFINVGIYLASPFWRDGQLYGWLKAVQFDHFGQQEVDLTASAVDIGRATSAYLKSLFGPCWVTELVLDKFVDADVWKWLREKLRLPDPCLSCPPFELFEEAVLGEIVRAAYSDMRELRAQINREGMISSSPLLHSLDDNGAKAAQAGMRAALEIVARDVERSRKDAAVLSRYRSPARKGRA